VDIIVANDLDTLAACYLASRIRRKELVYDSHEFFTEVPELTSRSSKQKIWASLEKRILPGLKHTYTVNQYIAGQYNRLYDISMAVIPNLPLKEQTIRPPAKPIPIPPGHLIIFQGTLNVKRGIQLLIDALAYTSSVNLLLIGKGNAFRSLKKYTKSKPYREKVIFAGKIPFEYLGYYTRLADIGVSLEENIGFNFRYAAPNKLFDYIHAGVPVIVSDLPVMKQIVEQYDIGMCLAKRTPQALAGLITTMITSTDKKENWKRNLALAASELNWEQNEQKLLDVYRKCGL
jgi:glycosyltransferase involved in cell wall biosynthesis